MSVAIICGGVGAARLLVGVRQVLADEEIIAIANVGDDFVLHGLHISPDLDTITYTTADAVSPERGWGLDGETWQAMHMLSRYGGVDWFSLGDRDLGTHLFRTQRMNDGASLTEVTAEILAGWDLHFRLLPVTNDPVRTMVTTEEEGEIPFQDYFVRLQHGVAVSAVRFDGVADARPAPGVLSALETADRIVIAPSNPVVSIDPVLAVPGVREMLEQRRHDVWAVSPIVGNQALKGPADRMMTELGREATVEGVAHWYQSVTSTLVIDTVDAALAPAVEAAGVSAVVMPTIMNEPTVTQNLAKAVCGLG